jgi:hypothetical protein
LIIIGGLLTGSGGGDQELGGVEGVGVPSGVEHALAKDQVGVAALADADLPVAPEAQAHR